MELINKLKMQPVRHICRQVYWRHDGLVLDSSYLVSIFSSSDLQNDQYHVQFQSLINMSNNWNYRKCNQPGVFVHKSIGGMMVLC